MRFYSFTATCSASRSLCWMLCLLAGTLGGVYPSKVWAQTAPSSTANLLPPWFLPKSPTASLLERFDTQQLVNLPTGGAQLSIPLASIQCGSLSIPVSLSYAYTGLKVGQPYDYVGLGWTLQAQCTITRQVNGLPDELFYNDPIHRYSPDTMVAAGYRSSFLERITRNDYDSGPDLYNYSLPDGTNGRFLLRDTTITLFPKQPVHIRRIGVSGFQIATENGLRYQFQAVELTSPNHNNFFSRSVNYNSAWHLTRLISGDNADTLRLHYSSPGSTLVPQQCTLTTGQYYTGESQQVGNGVDQFFPCGSAADYTFHNVVLSNNRITSQYLDSITTRGARLLLLREKATIANDRWELRGVRLLSTIGGRREIKRIRLYQSPFSGNDPSDYRLRLDSLQESTNGLVHPFYRFQYHNEVPLPSRGSAAQDFWGYANGVTQNGDITTTAYPTLLADPHLAFGSQRVADRTPDFIYTQAGALAAVQYPTGGTSQWLYEQGRMYIMPEDVIVTHDSTMVDVGPISYNAAHIQRVSYDALHILPSGGQPVTVSDTTFFQVTEEGKVGVMLSRQPWAAYNPNVSGAGNNATRDFNIWHRLPTGDTLVTNNPGVGAYKAYNPAPGKYFSFHLQPGTYYALVYCEHTEDLSELFIYPPYTDSSKVDIGPGIRVARTITKATGAPPLVRRYTYKINGKHSGVSLLPAYGKGFDQYQFTRDYRYSDKTRLYETQCQIINTSSSNRGVGNDFNKYDFFYSCVTEAADSAKGQTAHYYTVLTQQFNDVVPASQVTYQQNSGQLQLVQRTGYGYASDSLLTRYPLVQAHESLIYVDDTRYGTGHPPSQYVGRAYEVSTCFVAPTRTTQTSYDTQGNLHTTETRSYYERQRLVRTATSNSTGWTIQRFKRLNEYAPTSAVMALQVYAFNPIVETQTWFRPFGRPDSVLTGGQVTFYSPRWRSPASHYSLQLASPQPNPNQEVRANGKYTAFLSDSRYERQATVRYATPTGDVAQQQADHGLPTSYLTGYEHTLLIAQAKNATFAQIAATSFEPAATGRWQYDSTGTRRVKSASRTGHWAYQLDGASIVTRSQLPVGAYELTYWVQGTGSPDISLAMGGSQIISAPLSLATAPGNWHQYRVRLHLATASQVTLEALEGVSLLIDEVRLAPIGAQLTSYTHDPLIGMTSQTGPDGRTTFFEYDGLNRLVRTRDEQGRILSQQQYHYATQR